jgi:hypothetical protein
MNAKKDVLTRQDKHDLDFLLSELFFTASRAYWSGGGTLEDARFNALDYIYSWLETKYPGNIGVEYMKKTFAKREKKIETSSTVSPKANKIFTKREITKNAEFYSNKVTHVENKIINRLNGFTAKRDFGMQWDCAIQKRSDEAIEMQSIIKQIHQEVDFLMQRQYS